MKVIVALLLAVPSMGFVHPKPTRLFKTFFQTKIYSAKTATLNATETASPTQIENTSSSTQQDHFVKSENTEFAKLETWSKQIDFHQALSEFGSNVWIVSEQQLEDNVAEWLHLAGSADKIWFPLKANPSPAVLEVLARNGVGAECASAAEVSLARRAGFPNMRILYNTPAPNANVAMDILKSRGCIVIDSKEQLEEMDAMLQGLADNWDNLGKVLVRVNPNVSIRYKKGAEYTDLTSHANSDGKFGIPSEELVEALSELSNLRIHGLHVHVGTQMDHVEPFLIGASHLQDLAREISYKTKHELKILDLGGGLGIPFHPEDEFPTIAALSEELKPALDPEFEYWYEPGHALVGNAVGLLGSIEVKKTTRGREWAIANVGFDSVMKISLLGWSHPVLGPNGNLLPTEGGGAIGGPLCFAGDIVVGSTSISSLEKGDPIFIQHTGAYCGSCANTFNGRRSGGTIVLRTTGELTRVSPPAGIEDEPLGSLYSWGIMSKSVKDIQHEALGGFDPSALSSEVLTTHQETFDYLTACKVGDHSYEYMIQVNNQVSFCSMPLVSRIAADCGIVSIMHQLGMSNKSFPVWGYDSRIKMDQIGSKQPLHMRIHLSQMIPEANGTTKCTAKFTVNGGKASGSFEAAFKAK